MPAKIENGYQRLKEQIVDTFKLDGIGSIPVELDNLIQRLISENNNYGLVWEEKTARENFDQKISEGCLPYIKEDTKRKVMEPGNTHNNILIEGDNYHSLKILQATHQNRVDLIYIDPPYNTGKKDFKYNDKFVDKEDTYRHSKWLSFMSKRLKLAKALLSKDGFIFISIDDNEYANLRLLCDEIFGESRYFGTFTKKIGGGKNDSKTVKVNHEYLLCYRKSDSAMIRGNKQITTKEKTTTLQKWGDTELRSDRPNLYYPIYANVKTKKISVDKEDGMIEVLPIKNDGTERYWRWEKDTMIRDIHKLTLVETKDDFGKLKYDIHVVAPKGTVSDLPWSSFISDYSAGGSAVLTALLDEKVDAMYPKNLDYIKWIVSLALNPDAIVLDFFAGSGTTGQAVLELNKEDGGNRRFILCTNNENKICENVTYKRISRVIKGHGSYQGQGGGLSYYKVDFLPAKKPPEKYKTDQELLGDTHLQAEYVHCVSDIIAIKEDVTCYERMFTTKSFQIFFTSEKCVVVIYQQIYNCPELLKEIGEKVAEQKNINVYYFYPEDDSYSENAEAKLVFEKTIHSAIKYKDIRYIPRQYIRNIIRGEF